MRENSAKIRLEVTRVDEAEEKSETPKFVSAKKMRLMIILFHFFCLVFFVLCNVQLFYLSVISNY